MRRKTLVAFRPEVLDEVERLLEAAELSSSLAEEALQSVRNAKTFYAGEAPGIRLARPGELTRKEVE